MKRVNFLIREEQGAKRRQVETKGVKLAPQVGFEPTTLRLTAERLIAASRCKHETYTREKGVLLEFGGTLGVSPQHLVLKPNIPEFTSS